MHSFPSPTQLTASADSNKPNATSESLFTEYSGKIVKARKLTVRSVIPMSIEKVWDNVKTPELLRFIAKGMIRFMPADGGFPKEWETGQTYAVKMRIFGFIPFGGKHFLSVEKIDDSSFEISTKEWDRAAKIWNHSIKLREAGNGNTYYEDFITIYGGVLTGLITLFAKWFYIHRQKRWQIVAKEDLNFS